MNWKTEKSFTSRKNNLHTVIHTVSKSRQAKRLSIRPSFLPVCFFRYCLFRLRNEFSRIRSSRMIHPCIFGFPQHKFACSSRRSSVSRRLGIYVALSSASSSGNCWLSNHFSILRFLLRYTYFFCLLHILVIIGYTSERISHCKMESKVPAEFRRDNRETIFSCIHRVYSFHATVKTENQEIQVKPDT